MRTFRQSKIRRALLSALASVPSGYLLQDDVLRADAGRMLMPRPTTAEFDAEISAADEARLMVGIHGEDALKWQITDNGRAWLALNP